MQASNKGKTQSCRLQPYLSILSPRVSCVVCPHCLFQRRLQLSPRGLKQLTRSPFEDKRNQVAGLGNGTGSSARGLADFNLSKRSDSRTMEDTPDFSTTITSTTTTTATSTNLSQSSTSARDFALEDTASTHPRPSRNPSRSISSSSITSPIAIKKSRYAEPGTTDVHAELHTFSAHPHSPRSLKGSRPSLPNGRSASTTAETFLGENPVPEESVSPNIDFDIPRSRPVIYENTTQSLLPEPALTARSSLSSIQSRRLSGNSIHSLASVRGLSNPSTSTNAAEPGPRLRSASLMSSGKGPGMPQPQSEAVASNVTVTTSSSTQPGQVSSGNHNLTARDPHSHSFDRMRRTQRVDTSATPNANVNSNSQSNSNSNPNPNSNGNINTNLRSQPDRSRSRAKRRFSGSTANSSHSPSSDRAPAHREREEGRPISYQRNIWILSNSY